MKKAKNELMQFLAGFAMLIAGLFIFSQRVIVGSMFGFFGGLMLGGIRVSSGLIIVPLIIGIVWMFVSGASFPSKIMTGIGVFIIIAAIIMTTSLHLISMTLFDWILILVLIFGGAALCAKVLLADNYRDDDSDRAARKAFKKQKNNTGNTSASTGGNVSMSVDEELEKMKKNMK